MDSETTTVIFIVIMSLGFAVWFWSLIGALSMGSASWGQEGFEMNPVVVAGEKIIPGELVTLSKALINSFSTLGLGMFGSLYKIKEHLDERIVVEKVGPLICNQPTGLYFSEAEFALEPAGPGNTKISYRLGYKRLHRLLKKVALGLILGVGLPVMLIVGGVVWFFVVQSEQPNIRWQVLQTLQIVHALWPPFLIMWAYAHGKRQSKVFVENLIDSASE